MVVLLHAWVLHVWVSVIQTAAVRHMLHSTLSSQQQLHAGHGDTPYMMAGLPLHLRSTGSNKAQA
jgi:hypothetical protein